MGRHGRRGVRPCYHQACDTYASINLSAFDVNVDAVAYSTLQYAMSTGARGKGNFPTPSATAPVASGGSQGGLHDDEHATE